MNGGITMKKLTALCLAALLMMLSATALAMDPTYANTKAYAKLLDEYGVTYKIFGTDAEGDEKLVVYDPGEEATYDISYYFTKDNTRVTMCVWYLIAFDEKDMNALTPVLTTLNETYPYLLFHADDDNTVSVIASITIPDDVPVADLILEATRYIVSAIDQSIPKLAPFIAE